VLTKRLLERLPPDVAVRSAEIPASLRARLGEEDAPLLTHELIDRFSPGTRALSARDVLREVLPDHPLQHLRHLGPLGTTPAPFACRAFPAFGYQVYVSLSWLLHPAVRAPVFIDVHGSDRDAGRATPSLRHRAEAHRGVVLSPLFAMDLDDPEPDMAATVFAGAHRADLALLAMVSELGDALGTRLDRRLLWGFSFGGRFVNRFVYLHAAELTAAAAGAPGWTTMPWDDRDWWVGIGDVERRFGRPVDWDGLARLPYLLTVGEHDDAPAAVDHCYSPAELAHLGLDGPRLQRYGTTRRTRAENLAAALRERGAAVDLHVVGGVGHHDHGPMFARVWDSFDEALAGAADGPGA
jgi:hypothetical protein